MFPKIAKSTFVHKTAVVIGNVTIADNCGVWPHAVIRGDLNPIKIDEGTNVQDHVLIHTSPVSTTVIGKNVSLGHGCIIHGAKIGDNCLIGMNATVLDDCEIGEGSLIGANALVTEKMKIPPKSLVLGMPAKVIKQSEGLLAMIQKNAEIYRMLAKEHMQGKHERYQVFEFAIVDASEMREHEETIPDRVRSLTQKIKSDGVVTKPVFIDRDSKVILDGHHRFHALKALGCRKVPVYLVDYKSDCIAVGLWPDAKANIKSVTKDDVIRTAQGKKLYPPKTTRHRFDICQIDKKEVAVNELM